MDKYKWVLIGCLVAVIVAQIVLAVIGVEPFSPKDVYGRLA